jgi:hypothetical protein
MAEITHQLYPNVVIDTSTAVEHPTGAGWMYTGKTGNSSFPIPMIQVDPKELENQGAAAMNALAVALQTSGDVRSIQQVGDESEGNVVKGTILPAAQKAAANITGSPVDLMNWILQLGIDTPINLAKWASEGFEGDIPSERFASVQEPIGGSQSVARGFEAVGDVARAGIQYGEEELGYINTPLGKMGIQTLLAPFAFDMSPEEHTTALKWISLITQVTAGAPLDAKAIASVVVQLAKTAATPTKKAVYDMLSEMHLKKPATAAVYETLMGGAVGTSMVASVEGLEAVYPDAPQWMKNIVMAGGGLLLPLGAMAAGRTVWDVGMQVPLVKWPLKVMKAAYGSLTPAGAKKAASESIQTFGSDWRTRSEILDVNDQLRLALAEGRDMDPVTRISYTTPQMARAQADNLEGQLTEALSIEKRGLTGVVDDYVELTAAQITAQREIIEKLRRFANFQEGQLKTISEKGETIGADAYAKYSERMMDRRDLIFAALDDLIFKLDVGGLPYEGGIGKLSLAEDWSIGQGTGNYTYNTNILRAVQEGRSTNLSPERLEAIQAAYDKAHLRLEKSEDQILEDVQARVDGWVAKMPETMSSQERENFNIAIRREIETGYIEMDSYEDLLWNNIDGFNAPKAETYITPEGQDLGPQILIDGVPIGEHFAAKAAAIRGQAGEDVNQSKWLWKLAGRAALLEEVAKGPDPTAVAKKQNVVESLQRIVDNKQRILEREDAALTNLRETQPEPPDLQKARLSLEKLNAQLAELTRSAAGDLTLTRQVERLTAQRAAQEAEVSALETRLEAGENPLIVKAEEKVEKAWDAVKDAKDRLLTQQGELDITMGAKVTHEGAEVNLADEIADTSELGVKMVNEVPVGRSAQEVHNIISHLKREIAFELGRGAKRNAKKVKAISEISDDLRGAIEDPENFGLNPDQRDAATRITALKKDVYEKGSIGKLRGFTQTSEAQVPIEQTIDFIIPGSRARGKQETAIRQLENALTPITTGENTPYRVIVDENGTRTVEFDPNFNLEKYAEPPPLPFERMTVGGARRSYGFKVAEGTQATPANIAIVRNTLWDRLSQFGAGTEFDTVGASKWINNNKAAIEWLEKATGDSTIFENIVDAERVVRSIKNARESNLNRTIEDLRKAEAFDETFTEDGLRFLVESAAKRDSNIASAATLLDSPDPITLGNTFLKSYLDPAGKPGEILRDTLKVLENGKLEDGSNPALEGFKQAVAEALVKRSITGPGSGSPAAQQAAKLSDSLRADVRLWDPDQLVELSQSPQIAQLLSGLYGETAPTLFAKIAHGAKDQFAISRAAQKGVPVQDKTSPDVAGNIGRVIGGFTAKVTNNLVSALVLTGVFRRQALKIAAAIRGVAVEKFIVDLLMNPKLAVEAITEFPLLSPGQNLSITKRLKLWAQENYITKPGKRLLRMMQAPGILYEIGEPTKYEEQVPADIMMGPVTEAVPVDQSQRPTQMAVSKAIPESILSQINAASPPAPASSAMSPERKQLAQSMFPGEFLMAGHKGGLVSRPTPKKPRQMVS